jgi:hypothetical protein
VCGAWRCDWSSGKTAGKRERKRGFCVRASVSRYSPIERETSNDRGFVIFDAFRARFVFQKRETALDEPRREVIDLFKSPDISGHFGQQ